MRYCCTFLLAFSAAFSVHIRCLTTLCVPPVLTAIVLEVARKGRWCIFTPQLGAIRRRWVSVCGTLVRIGIDPSAQSREGEAKEGMIDSGRMPHVLSCTNSAAGFPYILSHVNMTQDIVLLKPHGSFACSVPNEISIPQSGIERV